jgi:hypothetical protein
MGTRRKKNMGWETKRLRVIALQWHQIVATERRDSWRNWRATLSITKKLEGPLWKVPQTRHGKPPVLPKQRTEVPRTGHGNPGFVEAGDGSLWNRAREPPEFWRNRGRNKEQGTKFKQTKSTGFSFALVTWQLGHPKKMIFFFFFFSQRKLFCEGKRRIFLNILEYSILENGIFKVNYLLGRGFFFFFFFWLRNFHHLTTQRKKKGGLHLQLVERIFLRKKCPKFTYVFGGNKSRICHILRHQFSYVVGIRWGFEKKKKITFFF